MTRAIRASNAIRNKRKQMILGGTTRLIRKKPVVITEEQLNRHYEELKASFKAGMLRVRVGSPEGPHVLFKETSNDEKPKEIIKASDKEEPATEEEPAAESASEETSDEEEPSEEKPKKKKRGRPRKNKKED